MSAMTWKEFKQEVDRQLADAGQSEDVPIWYIDISWPDMGHESTAPTAVVDEKMGLAI